MSFFITTQFLTRFFLHSFYGMVIETFHLFLQSPFTKTDFAKTLCKSVMGGISSSPPYEISYQPPRTTDVLKALNELN